MIDPPPPLCMAGSAARRRRGSSFVPVSRRGACDARHGLRRAGKPPLRSAALPYSVGALYPPEFGCWSMAWCAISGPAFIAWPRFAESSGGVQSLFPNGAGVSEVGGFATVRFRCDNRRRGTLNLPHDLAVSRPSAPGPVLAKAEQSPVQFRINQAAIARSSSKPKARGVTTAFPSKVHVISTAIRLSQKRLDSIQASDSRTKPAHGPRARLGDRGAAQQTGRYGL